MDLIRHSARRDLRVDFFRGLALWWIFTDHIPGDLLSNVSLRNFAMCDATEIFVLLAGYGAGLSYGKRLHTHGFVSSAADVLKRAWTLYVAHIFLFVLFSAQVSYSATALNRLSYLEESRLDVLGDDPYRSILEAVFLRFQPSLLNILPLYVVLLVLFAATIWLLRWPHILFGLSFATYLLVQITHVNLNEWTGEGWFFDPFAWQFLFVLGVLMACAPPRMPRRKWPYDILAIFVVVIGLITAYVIEPQPHILDWFSASWLRFLVIEDKTGLHPFRLASILSLTWLAVRLIPPHAAWLRTRWASVLVLLGQHSLPVFCAGIVLGFVARLGLEFNDRAAMQVAINLFGAVGMTAVGGLAAWYRVKDRASHAKERVTERSAERLVERRVVEQHDSRLPQAVQPDTG
ncbi:MAG TPA: OpgC domain-containing protein [Rhodopila sp.]|uniref:OpgC family protein n=1 Tax=Rhodopila sp. TaxID=2480087 RepID=UPI002BB44243|nr:OpgC domain-containing protein [Rhodopila sp.]HVY14482.1 OpgC domain-containing protein [Rhodopila sp.]HWB98629.1 OpgC domain-containing protein [Bryobacteraceae bacterium]